MEFIAYQIMTLSVQENQHSPHRQRTRRPVSCPSCIIIRLAHAVELIIDYRCEPRSWRDKDRQLFNLSRILRVGRLMMSTSVSVFLCFRNALRRELFKHCSPVNRWTDHRCIQAATQAYTGQVASSSEQFARIHWNELVRTL
jgi:hypothetical protein